MQGPWIWSLVQEDFTCCRATKPMCPSFWASTLKSMHSAAREAPTMSNPGTAMKSSACMLQLEKTCKTQRNKMVSTLTVKKIKYTALDVIYLNFWIIGGPLKFPKPATLSCHHSPDSGQQQHDPSVVVAERSSSRRRSAALVPRVGGTVYNILEILLTFWDKLLL